MRTAEYESQCTGAKKEEDNNNNDKNLQRKVQMLLKLEKIKCFMATESRRRQVHLRSRC